MITAQISKVVSSLALDEKFARELNDFFGVTVGYFAAMPPERASALMQITFRELFDMRNADSPPGTPWRDLPKGVLDIFTESMRTAIETMNEEQRNKYILANARKVPAAVVKVCNAIVENLTAVGEILECAPHDSLMFAKKIARISAHEGRTVHEVHGMPVLATWKAAAVQTMIINVIGMRSVAYAFIEFVHAMVRQNPMIFVIIIHSCGIIINFEFVAASMSFGDIMITLVTGNQKKIISISDVVKLDECHSWYCSS